MKLRLLPAMLVIGAALGGCAESTLLVGQPGAAIAGEDVVLYYIERPRCNFETVAHIQINGNYYSLQSMLDVMRNKAGELGASGLYVLQTQQLDIKDYLGTAKAIRCLPA